MKHGTERLCIALIGLFLVLFACSAVAGEPVIALGQTEVQNSLTGIGFVDVYVSPIPGDVGYVNVVSDLDEDGIDFPDDWIVQNFPLPMVLGEFGTFASAFSFTFSLGSLTPSGNYDVYASYTSSASAIPIPGTMQLTQNVPFTTYDIDDLQDGALIGGLDAGGPRRIVPTVKPVSVEGNPGRELVGGAKVIGRVRHDIPGILQGKNECAPTSAAQSLLWLAARHGLAGLPAQANLIDRLKRAMNTGWAPPAEYPGIAPANFLPGKKKVIRDLRKQLNKIVVTKRGGQLNGTGTFDFVKAEIERDEDVEMRIQYTDDGGHWVTIAGWFDNGVTKRLHFKDPLTGGNAVEAYELDGTTIRNYRYGNPATISFAVSQSILKITQVFPGTSGGKVGVHEGYGGMTGEAISAVPGVLEIVPGNNWSNFVAAAQEDPPVPYTVKNVVMCKQTPDIVQCADVFPSKTVCQQGTPNIRLWWPLMYEVPGTTWELTILYGTSEVYDPDGNGPEPSGYVHTEKWNWSMDADLTGMKLLLELFHELPFGMDEVPLISDEELYPVLQAKLDSAIQAVFDEDFVAAAAILGDFEMEVMDACIGTSPSHPNPSGPGTGIANSVEHPACCKLLADAWYVGYDLGVLQPTK